MSPILAMTKIFRILSALLLLPLCHADERDAAPPSAESNTSETASTLSTLEAQAEEGDSHAANQLCLRYALEGKTEQARRWGVRYRELLEKEANGGDTRAMMLLGTLFMTGQYYTEPSVAQTVEWFSRADEAGEPSASFILGDFLARQGNQKDSREAYARSYEGYTRLAREGNLNALYWQGYMEQNGVGTEARPEEGIRKLEQAADKGHGWAIQQLFKTYMQGIGTEKDEARAISYARRAADTTGDSMMAWATACAYLNGQGVEKDEALGEHYLDIAAAGNIADAIFLKGFRLEKRRKFAEALPLYTQAASMKQPDAMINAGLLLLNGAEGVEKDESRGLNLLESAANSPIASARAACELGRHYEQIREPDIANSWYVTASDRGVIEAMARRGLLHLNPFSGVKWSPTLAYQWWRTGKEAGDADCTLYVRLFLYGFIPLILLLAFGLPIFIVHRLQKKESCVNAPSESQPQEGKPLR